MTMNEDKFPEDDPLRGKEDLMDTHEGRLKAFGEVLDDIDVDEVDGISLTLLSGRDVDVFSSSPPPGRSIKNELLMLSAHLYNLTATINETNPVDVEVETVAKEAARIAMESEEDRSISEYE